MENYTKKYIDDNGDTYYLNEYEENHRLDGPAVEYKNGDFEYWENGLLHNINGPACIYKDSGIEYWTNGQLHNANGPAAVYRKTIEYWVNGNLHNLDGPAITWKNGDREWYIDGIEYDPGDFLNHPLVIKRMIEKQLLEG
jgi:hypothetical protein